MITMANMSFTKPKGAKVSFSATTECIESVIYPDVSLTPELDVTDRMELPAHLFSDMSRTPEEKTRRISEDCSRMLHRRMQLRRIRSETSLNTKSLTGSHITGVATLPHRKSSLHNPFKFDKLLELPSDVEKEGTAAVMLDDSHDNYIKRKNRINEALNTLRKELRIMQAQDRQILRQFLKIQDTIHMLKHSNERERNYTVSCDDTSDDIISKSAERLESVPQRVVGTWPRRPKSRRFQSEPEYVMRNEFDSITDDNECAEEDSRSDESGKDENQDDRNPNTDVEPVFFPDQNTWRYPTRSVGKVHDALDCCKDNAGYSGNNALRADMLLRKEDNAVQDKILTDEDSASHVDIYDVSYEDLKRRLQIWKSAQVEKEATGKLDKKKAAGLKLILSRSYSDENIFE